MSSVGPADMHHRPSTEAVARLAVSDRLYEVISTLADRSPDPMVLMDAATQQIRIWNRAASQLFGWDAGEAIGQTLALITPPQKQTEWDGFCKAVLGGDQGAHIQTVRHRRDGKAVQVAMSGSTLSDQMQAPAILLLFHDLTDYATTAEQLHAFALERANRQAAEMANVAKSEFLSRMSHEMRTPLNAVLGFAQIIKLQGTADTTRLDTHVDHIMEAGKHLLKLVEDVLDLQRVAEGQLNLAIAPVSLGACMMVTEQFLSPEAQRRGILFTRDIPVGLRVKADEMRLRQVLLNVGSNAVKYNKTGGQVAWRAEPKGVDRVRLVVEDQGLGMTPAQLAKLFRPFERLGRENTAISGSGLGLMISKKMVEEMGGSITVSSEEGVGTRVIIELVKAE